MFVCAGNIDLCTNKSIFGCGMVVMTFSHSLGHAAILALGKGLLYYYVGRLVNVSDY